MYITVMGSAVTGVSTTLGFGTSDAELGRKTRWSRRENPGCMGP